MALAAVLPSLETVCGQAEYTDGLIKFPCGLEVDTGMLQSITYHKVMMTNNVHRLHHDRGHQERFWWIEVTTTETDVSFTETYSCSCEESNAN